MSDASILIADGDVLARHVLADYLRSCGYRVIEAASSDEAVAVLSDAAFDVDVVLCDALLGGALGGFGLARWLRTNRSDVDVVLAGTIDKAAEAAADLCEQGPDMARPYEPQTVVDRIRQLRAQRDRPSR